MFQVKIALLIEKYLTWVGVPDGEEVGFLVGPAVGCSLGASLGVELGEPLGFEVGWVEMDGLKEGFAVGSDEIVGDICF